MGAIVLAALVLAQSGTVSILCSNPGDPVDKEAFDLDYDQRQVRHSLRHDWLYFGEDFIRWRISAPNGSTMYTYELDRRTAVLLKQDFVRSTASRYNCQKSERAL